jgi:hypothetical protein
MSVEELLMVVCRRFSAQAVSRLRHGKHRPWDGRVSEVKSFGGTGSWIESTSIDYSVEN